MRHNFCKQILYVTFQECDFGVILSGQKMENDSLILDKRQVKDHGSYCPKRWVKDGELYCPWPKVG